MVSHSTPWSVSQGPGTCGTLVVPVPRRIEVKGYKSIREMALDLAPLNVLIGANGAGKSNLIQAFGLLREIVQERLQVAVRHAGRAARLLHRGPKVAEQIGLRIWEELYSYEAQLTFASDDSLFFEAERFTFPAPPDDHPSVVLLGRASVESRLSEEAALKQGGAASELLERRLAGKAITFTTLAPRRR